MIWMTDLASWIITLRAAGRASPVFPLLSSVLFRCHIWVTYCSVALRWCSVSLHFVSLSLSLLSYYLRVCRSAPWCHFFFFSLHSALHISFFLLSFFLVYTPTPPPPRAAHQGFFSDCPGCRRCANWRAGTFVISPLSATEQGAEFKVSPIQ